MIYMYNNMLLSYKKEWNIAICSNNNKSGYKLELMVEDSASVSSEMPSAFELLE